VQRMSAMLRFLVLAVIAALTACDGGQSDTPQSARGDTPVRYIICSVGGTGCFVAARFKDLDGCEQHKEWADSLCDRLSNPGKIICTKDPGRTIAIAYCTL